MFDIVTITSLSKLIEILSRFLTKPHRKTPKNTARRYKISKLKLA